MKGKRIGVAVVVIVLCLAMASVGLAASPVGGSVSAVDANGNPMKLSFGSIPNEKEIVGKLDAAKAPGKLVWLYEVSAPDGAEAPFTVTIAVNGVKAGDSVTIVHYVGGAWEYIKPSSVSNGQVVFSVGSLSPIGVVVNAAAPAPADDTAAGTTKSPKTGEADYAMVLALVLIAAAGAAFFTCRRLKSSKN